MKKTWRSTDHVCVWGNCLLQLSGQSGEKTQTLALIRAELARKGSLEMTSAEADSRAENASLCHHRDLVPVLNPHSHIDGYVILGKSLNLSELPFLIVECVSDRGFEDYRWPCVWNSWHVAGTQETWVPFSWEEPTQGAGIRFLSLRVIFPSVLLSSNEVESLAFYLQLG